MPLLGIARSFYLDILQFAQTIVDHTVHLADWRKVMIHPNKGAIHFEDHARHVSQFFCERLEGLWQLLAREWMNLNKNLHAVLTGSETQV